MEHFIGTNALLWQKRAVKVHRGITTAELQSALRCGGTFLHIQCGLYTYAECSALLDRCNEHINYYAGECQPWTVATGIICELSGPYPRVQFSSCTRSPVQANEGQRITLTADSRFESQCFDEIKYATNFDQLQRTSLGAVLSIDTVKLTVERIMPNFVTCRVTHAGHLKPFSVINIERDKSSNGEKLELDITTMLEELERVVDKGCKFIIVPQMDKRSLYTFLESIKCREHIASNIQIIAHADCSSASNAICDTDLRCIDAFVTKDIEVLKQKKATDKVVLYDLDTVGEIPESIEDADVIIASLNDLTGVNVHLNKVNLIQLQIHQKTHRTLDPDGEAMATCLNFSAQEANASAIILPCGEDDLKLAIKMSLRNPLCIVLLLTTSTQQVHRVLLRKYLVPVIVPAEANVSPQQLIRRAIAYGRRFGYLHGGNCIVAGFTVESDTDILGMELRYVPVESHRTDTIVP